MVSEDVRIRNKVPEIFEPMMVPHLERVDEMVSPGLTILRWTSLNIEAFVDSVTTSLQSLELLIDRARDIWEIQIEGNLKAIQTTQLCVLPESEPWTPDEFVSKTQVCVCVCVCVCLWMSGWVGGCMQRLRCSMSMHVYVYKQSSVRNESNVVLVSRCIIPGECITPFHS